MKLFSTFFILFVCFSLAATAQEPTILSLKGIGGNGVDQVATNVSKTSDGGFIISISSTSDSGTGNIDSFCELSGDRAIFLKYNADATILEWNMCTTNGSYLFPIDSSRYILGGLTDPSTGWAFKIIKQDSFGTIIWRKTYGNNASAILRNMIATDDGGYIMSGVCNYADTDFITHYGSWMTTDIGVIKLDSNGNKVWSKVIGGSEDDDVSNIVAAPNGGCYIVGTTASNDHDCIGNHGGNQDVYLARLDSNGNLLWHHDLGGSSDDGDDEWAVSDGKGGVLIANGSQSVDGDEHHHVGGVDYWVLDVDSNNNIVWENCYGATNGNEYATAICKATDGSIWITGVSGTAGGEVDTNYGLGSVWVVHTDSSGNYVGSKVLGGTGDNQGQMIYSLPGNFVITGGYYDQTGGLFSSLPAYGQEDVFLAVLSPLPTVVPKILSDNFFELFPNPTKDKINVIIKENNTGSLVVMNTMGQVVYKEEVVSKKSITINVNEYPVGLYCVVWCGTDGSVQTAKVIKN